MAEYGKTSWHNRFIPLGHGENDQGLDRIVVPPEYDANEVNHGDTAWGISEYYLNAIHSGQSMRFVYEYPTASGKVPLRFSYAVQFKELDRVLVRSDKAWYRMLLIRNYEDFDAVQISNLLNGANGLTHPLDSAKLTTKNPALRGVPTQNLKPAVSSSIVLGQVAPTPTQVVLPVPTPIVSGQTLPEDVVHGGKTWSVGKEDGSPLPAATPAQLASLTGDQITPQGESRLIGGVAFNYIPRGPEGKQKLGSKPVPGLSMRLVTSDEKRDLLGGINTNFGTIGASEDGISLGSITNGTEHVLLSGSIMYAGKQTPIGKLPADLKGKILTQARGEAHQILRGK